MKRVQAIMACAAMAFFLAACGGSDEASNGDGGEGGQDTAAQAGSGEGSNGRQATMSEAAIEEQYAQGQYTLTEDGAADDQYEDVAPEDLPFPLPPDAEIIAAGERPDEAYLAAMNVSSEREAYEFYLEAVPDAGYEVLNQRNSDEGQDGEGAFSGRISVEGEGYRGSIRFGEGVAIITLSRSLAEQAERLQERQEKFQQRAEERQEEQQEGEGTQPPDEDRPASGEAQEQNAEEAPEEEAPEQ